MNKDIDIKNEIKLMKYLAENKELFQEFCDAVKEGKITLTGHNHDYPLSKWNSLARDLSS